MREIKFRGKLKEKGMSGWIEGSLVHITRTYKGEEDEQECDIYQIINEDGVGFFIDKETIGQFTGLHDKNGKEIYEGDITDAGYNNIGVVKYGEYNCSCCEGVYGWYVDGGDIRSAERFLEVIGNLYENTDLLKGADNI